MLTPIYPMDEHQGVRFNFSCFWFVLKRKLEEISKERILYSHTRLQVEGSFHGIVSRAVIDGTVVFDFLREQVYKEMY